ncbi:YkvI family membrane protein [Sporosalibacterium faouarense]|uniref:YkvI family membrane protein n=1 Tax=Sporosalibacterium faouarense TaxID=516123 RepID=UPI00141C5327|nr:hypothetical protein [Sporosalibacterium faouarense]MTI46204.1 hypothetical protein [Bacillota bacterium]
MESKGWGKIASVYIGTIIGAGFASGQEIVQFFSIYGYRGIFGLIIATILFSSIGAIVLNRVYKNKIEGYEEFLLPLFGRRLGKGIELIITLFLFTSFCVMLAGSGAIFHQQFHISYNVGIYIMSICALLTFMFSVKGITTVNSILVPLLLIGITTMGVMVILREGVVFSNYNGAEITKTGNWITSSILYVSYNSISAIVIMTSLLPIIHTRNAAIKGGIMGGLGLGLLALFIIIPTLILYTDICKLEIPMLKIAGSLGKNGSIIYTLILWCSMFTTAVANGFGFVRRASSFLNTNQRLLAVVFCIVSIPLAKLGFANLVTNLYPIFGYIGSFMLFIIIGNFILRRLI